MPNERILDNLRKTVAKPGPRVWVRHPLIPQFSDSEEDLEELCRARPHPEAFSGEDLPAPLPSIRGAEVCRHGQGHIPGRKFPRSVTSRSRNIEKLVESHGIEVDVGR